MPGEERWRVLEIEPTRALGHGHSDELGSKFFAPNRRPEIVEWQGRTPWRTHPTYPVHALVCFKYPTLPTSPPLRARHGHVRL